MASGSVVGGVSRALGSFRWAFVPLGLCALVAVGVHAAAELVDDRLLVLVDLLDERFDRLAASWELTAGWSEWWGPAERTWLARGLTLVWELAADALFALPMLGYAEADGASAAPGLDWRSRLGRALRRPTPARVVRPALVACFAVGGAYTVSTLVEATAFVALAGDVARIELALPLSRLASLLAGLAVLGTLGWRAVVRAAEHGDALSLALERRAARGSLLLAVEGGGRARWAGWRAGLVAHAVGLPLALALLLEARVLGALVR